MLINNKFVVKLLTKCKDDNSREIDQSKSSASGCPTGYLENASTKFLISFYVMHFE